MEKLNSIVEKQDLLICKNLTPNQLPKLLNEALSVAPEGEMRDMLLLSLLTNIRYAMYGISLVRYAANYPWYVRCYLVWTLTDETYALESSTTFRGRKRMYYSLMVSSLNHLYWLTGSVVGAAAGAFITFDTAGIDFAMTALFLVVLTDLVRSSANRIPALTGGISTLLALIFFVAVYPNAVNRMLLAAMALMITVLLILRKKYERKFGGAA